MGKSEQIKTIYKLNDELELLISTESDLYKKALDQKGKKVEIERGGKKVMVSYGELFEEIRVLSQMGRPAEQATKILEKAFPKLFKVVKKREAKNKELHEYIKVNLGFDFFAMKFADHLKLTEWVLDYKLKEKGLK